MVKIVHMDGTYMHRLGSGHSHGQDRAHGWHIYACRFGVPWAIFSISDVPIHPFPSYTGQGQYH